MAIPAEQTQQPSAKPAQSEHGDSERIHKLLNCYPHKDADKDDVVLRFQHRINLARAWDIPANSHILDIGCGQGESSLVLALLNGPPPHRDGSATVTGIDTAPEGYGGPFTVLDSQRYIRDSSLGPRIRFLSTDAPALLLQQQQQQQQPSFTFDAATLCHSLWYFPSSASVSALFSSLHSANVGPIKRVYLAEYTGSASSPEQLPHELAAKAQSLLVRSRKPKHRIQDWNVRTHLQPSDYLALAAREGWKVEKQGTVAAPLGMIDGHREAHMIQSERFRQHVHEEMDGLLDGEQAKDEVLRVSKAVKGLYEGLMERGEMVRCMDIWWAVLGRAE